MRTLCHRESSARPAPCEEITVAAAGRAARRPPAHASDQRHHGNAARQCPDQSVPHRRCLARDFGVPQSGSQGGTAKVAVLSAHHNFSQLERRPCAPIVLKKSAPPRRRSNSGNNDSKWIRRLNHCYVKQRIKALLLPAKTGGGVFQHNRADR